MRQVVIQSGTPVLLVTGDPDNPVPTLIQNVDPVNTIFLGEYIGLNPIDPNSCAPLSPGQSTVASGVCNVFAVTLSGQIASCNVYMGLMSFFQPLSQLVIAGPQASVLIYSPSAGLGNLVGSWSAVDFVDQYGNPVNAGLNANQGTLTSMLIQAALIQSSTLESPVINDAAITNASVTGGTITETAITFDTSGGLLLLYATTTTTVTFNTSGHYSWTSPITGPADIRVWGADAGAGGGSAIHGGEGGGGGELGREPNYQLINGQSYSVDVGTGGTGGTTGNGGNDGGDSGFDDFAVYGQGGQAGSGFIGGHGGNASINTFHFPGGNGGGDGTQSTGGCGGGGRAGISGPGGNGAKSSGTGGANGGTAGNGTGGRSGANGGNNGANGNNGPAGGGGCGAASQSQQGSSQYRLTSSATYYGSDASGGNANQQRSTGTMYQGGETASGGSFNGTQKSLGIIAGNAQSDLAGKIIDTVSIRLECLHSWYNNGLYVILGYNGRNSLPSSWTASDITSVKTWFQKPVTKTTDLTGAGLGTALQNGSAQAITLGPGAAYDLNNYGYFYGAGGDNNQNPLITITWHTGSQPVKAGNGGDGMVTITYANTQTLIGALSSVAGTDAATNAYAIGYTGQVQAFQPSSSPAIVESWHNVTPPSGWSGVNRYKMVAETNCAFVDIQCTHAGASGNVTFMTLPVEYRPATLHSTIPAIGNNSAPANQNQRIDVNTSGAVTTFALPTSTTSVKCFFTFPLD